MAVELRLALLGEVQVTRGGEPVTGFVSAKAQALLCYLAVDQRTHQRAALAGLLWGELAEEKAATGLRVALSNLPEMYRASAAWEDLVYNLARPLKTLRVEVFDDPNRR